MGRNLIKLCARARARARPQTSPWRCNLICRKEQAVSHDWFKAPLAQRLCSAHVYVRTRSFARCRSVSGSSEGGRGGGFDSSNTKVLNSAVK